MDPTPASHLHRAIPVLPVLDLEIALAFYESSLGFLRRFEVDDDAGVGRDGNLVVHAEEIAGWREPA